MDTKRKLIIGGIATAGLMTIGVGSAYAATNGGTNYPTPGPVPTVSITPSVTPTIPPPVINPFRGCTFTTTREITQIPRTFRVVVRNVPSITCVGPRGVVNVYTITR
jgi:hypothetical protein